MSGQSAAVIGADEHQRTAVVRALQRTVCEGAVDYGEVTRRIRRDKVRPRRTKSQKLGEGSQTEADNQPPERGGWSRAPLPRHRGTASLEPFTVKVNEESGRGRAL